MGRSLDYDPRLAAITMCFQFHGIIDLIRLPIVRVYGLCELPAVDSNSADGVAAPFY